MADEKEQPQEASAAELLAQTHGGKPTIAIKVYAPFKVYYEGDGYSISAVNDIGPFDILPKHHNFLCMLVPCNLVIESPEGQKIIKISRALMHVKANRVVVFVDV
ncbi:MAG: atpC [Candidatus Saccharibacteria bacterium]|nr:atpC [Candidatus Saccharibacteria bacterium]